MKALTEIDKNLFYLESNGSFKEIGENYGKLLTHQIHEKIAASMEYVDKKYTPEKIVYSIAKLKTSFQNKYPYLWEEIEGVCAGANVLIQHFITHI